MLIAPWPATAPPRIITVSPGTSRPTKAPVSAKAKNADQEVGPGPERVGDVLEHLLDVDQLGEGDVRGQDRGADRPPRSPTSATPSLCRPAASWRDASFADDRVVTRPSASATRSAAARSSQSPTAVGPLPVSIACPAPAAAQGVEGVADLGANRARRRLEVVDEQVRVGERRGAGAGRRAEPAGDLLELRRVAAEAEAVGLGEDPRRAQPSPAGRQDDARAGRGRAGARPAPRRRARARARGTSCEGTSAPSSAASSSRSPTSPAASRRTAAASALPPPSPAAIGIRFSISIRSGGPAQPLRAQRRPAPARRGSRRRRAPRRATCRSPPPRRRSGRPAPAARTASRARAGRRAGAARGRGRG